VTSVTSEKVVSAMENGDSLYLKVVVLTGFEPIRLPYKISPKGNVTVNDLTVEQLVTSSAISIA